MSILAFVIFIHAEKCCLWLYSETRLVPPGGGQFRLDLDDNDMSDNYAMPQLIEPDLNEILNEPVKLPVTRLSAHFIYAYKEQQVTAVDYSLVIGLRSFPMGGFMWLVSNTL